MGNEEQRVSFSRFVYSLAYNLNWIRLLNYNIMRALQLFTLLEIEYFVVFFIFRFCFCCAFIRVSHFIEIKLWYVGCWLSKLCHQISNSNWFLKIDELICMMYAFGFCVDYYFAVRRFQFALSSVHFVWWLNVVN